jgi:hypothetical protein
MKIIAITPDRKRDYTAEIVIDGFKKLGVEIIASDIGNGILDSFSESQILSVDDADFVVSFFGKIRDNNSPKYHLLDSLKNKFSIAYVDGSEWTYTGYQNKNQIINSLKNPRMRKGEPWINEKMRLLAKSYFKRECYQDDLESGIIPLPFALSDRHLIKNDDKDIDVMCVFGQNMTGLRKEVIEHCLMLKKVTNYNIVVSDNLDQNSYKNVISRSRIVIDAWGGGDNCDRFYEAIGARACCLYQKYNVIVENPFIDFKHAVSFEDMSSFADKLELLLKSEDMTFELGKSGFLHALEHHSSVNRAKTIIDSMVSK